MNTKSCEKVRVLKRLVSIATLERIKIRTLKAASSSSLPRLHHQARARTIVRRTALSGDPGMQTVWSRAAQAQCVCKCPSCLLTTNAIARRTSIATARRTIRVGDVFTVSVSSLAAGLALAGSVKKDDRRKQWDKVIEGARATVEATEIQQQKRLAALSDDARREALDRTRSSGIDISTEKAIKEVEAWDARESEEQEHQDPILYDRNDNWLDVFDWAQEQHRLREASGFQDWRGLPLSLLQSLSRVQLNELLSNERLLRRFYGGPDCNSLVDEQSRYPLSMKKIRTLEWSVARMVLKLLIYCSTNSLGPQQDSSCPTRSLLREFVKDGETIQSKLDRTRERLRILHAERRSRPYYEEFESPQIPNYDDTTIEEYEQTTDMNISLQKLLELMKPDTNLNDLMSKICYNLLTARTPPNTHTYNMLLIRFCILGKEDLIKAVLSSMRESHIRPNEITHATVLRHFTATGNRVGFVDYWRRMEGRRRGGLALANPELDIHPVLQERYIVFESNYHKAAEKGRMNAQVYESLIVGALHFLGGQTAMHYYRNMISEGWSPSLGIFLAILQDCCHKLDWTLGQAILEQLEKSAERMNTLTYEWMLRLCQCCGQQEFFDQILRSGVHCGALPATMLDLPNHAKIDDVASLIERAKDLQPRKMNGSLEKMAARMSYRLGDKSPFLVENVFHFEDEDTRRNTINRMNDRWKTRVTIQNRLDNISTDIYYTVLEANHALYASKHLSSVKFWLSRQVKRLETEFEQNVNDVADALHSDTMRDQKAPRTHARAGEDVGDQSSNSVELPVVAGSSENEHVSHPPPPTRQPALVQWSPPNLPRMTDSPNGSFWKEAESQMAAMP